MKWKNNYPDNHCFFITSTVNGKFPILCDKSIHGLLLNNLEKCRVLFNFKILGYVIMPEHWHLLLYFRSGNDCLSFIRDFKRFTSEKMITYLQKHYQAMLTERKREINFTKIFGNEPDEWFLSCRYEGTDSFGGDGIDGWELVRT